MSQSFDILVVGAGPAGIAAATRAAESGKRVGLVDDNFAPGGQIWRGADALSSAAAEWYKRLAASPAMQLQGWRIFSQPSRGILRAEKNGVHLDIAYNKLILATGARERFLPFPGWTLPNVLGAGALQALVKSGLPIEGKRVVIAGSGPLLLAVAAYLTKHGARILEICEQASRARLAAFATSIVTNFEKLQQAMTLRWQTRGAHFHTSCWPIAAHGSDDRLESVTLRKGNREWTIPCDYLACGFHLVPNTELAELLGCTVTSVQVKVDENQLTSIPGIYCAGEPTGIGGLESSLIEGEIAGYSASGQMSKANALQGKRRKLHEFASRLETAFGLDPALRHLPKSDTIVCRCEDVPFNAMASHSSWRDAKLQTRCGMGPCQGRICGPAAEFLFGWRPDSIRPPVFPTHLSSLADASAPLEAQLKTK
ncbi:NAD(P)/FAD-dependent oxidoreductase [Alloacidobacterium dinghuense]|uniref:NAD(P)/FAD-dependent oxidoreductase n=1 Tax=Alloacidobacterium dinghuense TaxID=2763107 RepID=UPI0020371A52|nr:FAD/NAD(P)-binding oxidoreductase [Alloacidobacterium dinghuense]